MTTELSDLEGTRWRGECELWLDPLGDAAERSPCTVEIEPGVVRYTWEREGQAHTGSLTLVEGGARFTDTWHAPEPMDCASVPGSWALLGVAGTYGAGEGPDWGWRSAVCLRPMGGAVQLVLQMTNIAPWGEEARAVRMVCARVDEAPA